MIRKLFSQKKEEDAQVTTSRTPNNRIEQEMSMRIASDIYSAEAAKFSTLDEIGFSLEDTWKDEEKIYKGGGLQWCTDFAYRSKRMRRIRPNSEDNFVFNSVQIMAANITSNTPEPVIRGTKNQHEVQAKKVQDISRYNDEKNEFKTLWRRTVLEFLKYGPAIIKVCWNSEIYGGKGPDRWIGDVQLLQVRKEDFFPDPAILDLELDIDECKFISQRYRKTLPYIWDRWDYGKYVNNETNTELDIDEGNDSQMAYVYEYFHRGFPEYMPQERKQELLERAEYLEERGYVYKAQDIRDMAESELEGVHVAYYSDGILLEYVPYIYDNGRYPFAYNTRYDDEVSHWGYGEIRNIKIPQVLHNKADEVEMEAMARQGLGGSYYRKNAIDSKQMAAIKEDSGKGGMHFEVNDPEAIKPRDPVQVPSNIPVYKDHKQRMIEVISQVTQIHQGQQSHSGMPYKSVAELGARGDVRMRVAQEKLEQLLVKVNRLRIDLFEQFYTEERYYRVKGPDGETIDDGTFSNEDMYDVWIREVVLTGDGEGQEMKEHFVPDFDITIDIVNAKPTDRNFYANIAFTMHDRQAITVKDLWKTIDEGRLPDLDMVLQHLFAQDSIQGMIAALGELPPEVQEHLMNHHMEELSMAIQQAKQMLAEPDAGTKGGGDGVANPQNQFNKPQQKPQPGRYADTLDYSGGLVGGQNFDTITGR